MQQDAIWVEQYLAGDARAFEHLVELYQSEIHYLVLCWVRSPEDAEEITQEVFLRAYQNLDSLRNPQRFAAWLRQIARNACRDWRRRKVPDVYALQTDVASDRPSADELLLVRETLAEVMQAVDALPETERMLLKARCLDGASYLELQQKHELSYRVVASHLSRARQRLRKRYRLARKASKEGTVESSHRLHSMIDQALAALQDTYTALDQGEQQGHEERLRQAANHLWQAYRAGAKEPNILWPLAQLWTNTGHLDQVIKLLKDYITSSQDPEERFLAGHYVVDTYALMESDELAVEHHRRYMVELGPSVPAWRRLWSFADSTMLQCWKRNAQLDDWLALSLPIYESVPVDNESRLAVAYYVRTLGGVWADQQRWQESISCAERLVELYRGNESPDAFRLTTDALCSLVSLYQQTGDLAARERTMCRLIELPDQIENARQRAETSGNDEGHELAELYRRSAGTICHNLAFKMAREGRGEDSIALFERALSYREAPITRFFYAGVLMEVRGDREGALANLRKAAADPRSSLVHRFEEAFLENDGFASVHDDPGFLAVVREAVARYQAVAGVQG